MIFGYKSGFVMKGLLEKLIDGDESAFKYLFDSHYRALTNFAYRFFRDADLAKDVVQNVFVKIYQNRPSLRTVDDIKNYLYKAVYNECLNELKKQDVRDRYHDQYASLQETTFFEQTLEQTEKENLIYQAIENLPPQCKRIFLMSRIEGKKNPEIADALKISVRTVETQISLALKNLRKTILLLISLLVH
jgi:RNA polymerase sigma-70 factor (family 1)